MGERRSDYRDTESGRRFARRLTETLEGQGFQVRWVWRRSTESYLFQVDLGDLRLRFHVCALEIDRSRVPEMLLERTTRDITARFDAAVAGETAEAGQHD